jgi:pyruvate formate-lyase/glycerol dehydratase family glycyl radical enzyme
MGGEQMTATNWYDDIRITERIKKLRDNMLGIQPGICIERAKIVTNAYKEYEAYPNIVKRALSLEKILKEMSIYIQPGELIVGNLATKDRWAPIFPEYSWDWIVEEIDTFQTRKTDPFLITEEDKEELLGILEYWKGKTLKERAETLQPEEVRKATKIGIIEWVGNVTSGEGHIAVDLTMALKEGYSGIVRRIQDHIDSLNLSDPRDIRKLNFLKAARIVFEAGIKFAARYRKLAEKILVDETNERRRRDLESIIEVLKVVPEKPAENFYQAIQSLWLTHLITQIEASGHSMSLGRIDQYLYPYYKIDIAEKRMTNIEVVELIDCLFLKLFSINKLRNHSHSKVLAGYPTYQNITIGGQDPDGKDAVNDLSFCFLCAHEHMRLSEPNIYIRYHDKISIKFLNKVMDVISLGTGMPAIVNDKVCIPSLMNRQVDYFDAVDYSTMGCLEIEVPGKWGYRANGKSKFNLAKVLELAIYGGKDPRTGILLLDSGKQLKDCTTYEEFFAIYKEQLEYFMKVQVTADNINDYCMEEMVPDAFCSALVHNCIERGKNIKEGGPIYDWISGAQIGVPNVGNSLAALKYLVFDNKRFTAEEVQNACESNFSDKNGIYLRKALLTEAPKYGNDNDYVDFITKDAFDVYCKNISKYKNMRYGLGPIGGGWYPSTVTLTANVPAGEVVGATPDGRLAGKPLADGVSSVHGTALNGPTAEVNSVSKLSNILMTGGQLFNMRLVPQLFDTNISRSKILSLLKTFFDLYGFHIQFNIISSKILKEAQEEPERYKDLVVRVAGYSAFFVSLDKDIQEDIISRTQYAEI